MQVFGDSEVSHPTLFAAEQLRLEAVENPSTFGGAQPEEYIRGFTQYILRVIGVGEGVCEKFSQVRTCPPLPHRLAPAKAKPPTPPPFRALLVCPVRGRLLIRMLCSN